MRPHHQPEPQTLVAGWLSLPDVARSVGRPDMIFRQNLRPNPEVAGGRQSEDNVLADRQTSSELHNGANHSISFGSAWSSCHNLAPSPCESFINAVEVRGGFVNDGTPPASLPQTGTPPLRRVVVVKRAATIRNQRTTEIDDDHQDQEQPTVTRSTVPGRQNGLRMRSGAANCCCPYSTSAAPSDLQTSGQRPSSQHDNHNQQRIGDANLDASDSKRKWGIGSGESGATLSLVHADQRRSRLFVASPTATASSTSASRRVAVSVAPPLSANKQAEVLGLRSLCGDNTSDRIVDLGASERVQVVVEVANGRGSFRDKIFDYVSRVKTPTATNCLHCDTITRAIRRPINRFIGQLGVGASKSNELRPEVEREDQPIGASKLRFELETPSLATKGNSNFNSRLSDSCNSNIVSGHGDGRESNKMLSKSRDQECGLPTSKQQPTQRQMIEESGNANCATKRTASSNVTRCAYQRELDDRRSTYCSSVGATTDFNYDSSVCSDSNNNNNNNQIMTQTTSNSKNKMQDSRGSSGGRSSSSCKIKLDIKRQAPVKARENWANNFEFLLAVIGFAVDLGNVWRFPYICYKNGGGAFLIPYTVMFILGGLPIFYLEMSLGQYFSSGCLTIWKRICPLAKGIGYAMCVLNFFTSLYYNTIISWAVFFFVESFTSVLPWTSCNNKWNSPDCRTIEQRQAARFTTTPITTTTDHGSYDSTSSILANQTTTLIHANISTPTRDYFEREVLQVHRSQGIDDLGYIRKPLAAYLAIVYVCIYFAIWKGVKSTGKAVWITALLPYFVLIPLLVRGVFLEGAWLGIKYYLYPDWAKIIDVEVWVEAAKQIYFSLGPGFGTLMALSSYNKFHHNCQKDALIAASVNYFASFISGLVIFAVLGYMATIENVSIADVATEGPGLVFQVYPEGLATMKFSSLWSILFFIMVITLGIDSTFGGLESVITGLCDEYPRVLRAHRGIFIGLLIIVIYICSLPTTTYGGNYVIYVLESYGTSLSLLFIVLIETVIVCWLYGADRFCKNLEEMHGSKPGPYWRICWKYISPTILLLIFMAACGQELGKYHILKSGDYTYPGWAPTVGLLMTGSSLCCVPIYAIYYLKTKTSGSILERLKIACTPLMNDQDETAKDPYVEALNKIRDENDDHRDTVI